MNNKLFKIAVWFTPLLGVAAGVFYALFMQFGYDDQGLLLKNDTYQYFLIAALALSLVPAVLCAVGASKTPKDNENLFLTSRPGKFPEALYVIAAVAAGAAGFVRLAFAAKALDVMGLVLGVLGVGSCVALFVLVKFLRNGEVKKVYGTLFLLPAVWMAIRLIVVFRDVSINPTISAYFYDVLAGIAVLLSYYSCVSMLYQRKNYFFWMLTSSFAVTMTICVGLGKLLGMISAGTVAQLFLHPIANGETLAFCLLLLFGLCFSAAAMIHWASPRAKH